MSSHPEKNEGIVVDVDDARMEITIDRPEVLNALDPPAHQALSDALDRFAADDDLRVAIITGAGRRSFCVGSDLKARLASNRDLHPKTGFAGFTHRFDLAKPVISAVNGFAIGGGLEIVLASDIALAADHVYFQLPETKVGLAAIGGGGLPARYPSSMPWTSFSPDAGSMPRKPG
ncbi:MAG: enoyl-CoA hydratase-related protein [Geminicoccaceae bacterium]